MKNNSRSNIKSLLQRYHSIKAETSPESRRNIQSMLGDVLSDKESVFYDIFEMNNIKYMWTNQIYTKNFHFDVENIQKTIYDNAILYCHGGGYVIGDISYCKIISSKLANNTLLPVLSFEYPLAPEHPYPAQLNSAIDAFLFLSKVSKNITIVGESAGGHLAISLAKKIQEKYREEFLKITSIVCLSPWTDLTMTSKSYETKWETDPILSIEAINNFRNSFAPNMDYTNPYLSPIFMDFSDFPPVLIQVGSNEILLDDSVNLHENLISNGVISYFSPWYNYWHIFQTFPDNILLASKQAMKQVGNFVLHNINYKDKTFIDIF